MPIRLDLLVAERFGLSRRAAQDAILNGRIDLEGRRCDEPGRMVEREAAVEFHPNRPKARRVVGPKTLSVLHEDPHLMIVDKPAGLATVGDQTERDTLQVRANRYLTLRYGGKPFVGIVHRLDKDTSGALALARSQRATGAMQELLRTHDVERQYLAVVEGNPRNESGTIDLAIAEGEPGEVRQKVDRDGSLGGKPAVTHYRVLERFGPVASLVACWLETGRTHQIRVHLAALGHPVVGDVRYRPPDRPRSKATFHRQALHAQTLGFHHPLTARQVRVEAPVPHDLQTLIVDLRKRYGIPGAGG